MFIQKPEGARLQKEKITDKKRAGVNTNAEHNSDWDWDNLSPRVRFIDSIKSYFCTLAFLLRSS